MGGAYVPEAGDLVWLHFDPQSGHEQKGHRPALVLTPASYNAKTGLMVCCPMTTRAKGYPFEVRIVGDIPGVLLADQVKSLDWRERQARFKGRVTALELDEAKAKACALIGRKA
ncbi:MAG: endoribonuclease MazF [Gammaproteobacteria bacterium]|jgi:mRNA interferase MazF|nr:endoribonuclease MazF [Gammaproteobacteria bacterium]